MAGPGAQRFEAEKKKARIEIIPLIDVIFFLLATFVLFTLSLEKIKSVDVNLPVSQPAQADPNDDSVTLQVSDGKNIYWNKDLINLDQLDGQIQSYKRNVRIPRVLITGDDKATYGTTVAVLDKVRASGIEQVSVQTSISNTGK